MGQHPDFDQRALRYFSEVCRHRSRYIDGQQVRRIRQILKTNGRANLQVHLLLAVTPRKRVQSRARIAVSPGTFPEEFRAPPLSLSTLQRLPGEAVGDLAGTEQLRSPAAAPFRPET